MKAQKMKRYGYHIKGTMIMGKTKDTSKRELLERIARSFEIKKSRLEVWAE